MISNIKPIYQRVILKLSGEILQGTERIGIDARILNNITQEIKYLLEISVQVGIVIGGGNFFRGSSLVVNGMNRIIGDYIGMFATIINGLALYDAMYRAYINSHLISAIPFNGICSNYNWIEINKLLCNNYVIIFIAGTGNPLFTTDSAACLRGVEINADVILKATKVDGVFHADPIKHPNAKIYNKLSYKDVLKKELKIMDLAAFTLARDHNIPIHVFNMNKPNALKRVIMGDKEGTLITN